MKITWNCLDRIIFSALCLYFVKASKPELVISVKNGGGDILQESIWANTTEDTVTLEFQRPDGTLITQFIDFKTDVQIFRALVLGEEERGQSRYQVMCFILKFSKNEFISADAMSKLRQKNPGTVRHPEEEKVREQFSLDVFIDLDKASIISNHIYNLCSEARSSTYAREMDLKLWAGHKGTTKDASGVMATIRKYSPSKLARCKDSPDWWKPCLCRFEICIGWYPCGLKYCKGKDSSGKVISYRCGIKTCRKCRVFEYYVKQKQQCLWDE